MSPSKKRIADAFAYRAPDRTPLFEIYSPFHPVYWDICGRNPATDAGMYWDALAEGITREELLDLHVDAQYEINRYFELDMVRYNGVPAVLDPRPAKTGEHTWTRNGLKYHRDSKTDLVVLDNPAEDQSYSHRYLEEETRREVEAWDGTCPEIGRGKNAFTERIRRRAEEDGMGWVYMVEIGAGTGVAFYPPFLLMWMVESPDLFQRWIEKQKLPVFERTRRLIEDGAEVVAMGGDVSCDKGPFISPAMYREFILPVIREHVEIIHDMGAKAVYTSDGNHWPIRDMFFFESEIDGYKEVDKAAGMTWPRLIKEGVADRVCILGNMDARHTMCLGSPDDVEREVIECLDHGRRSPGGHILHLSHSVHEDIPVENYYALVNGYRKYFGMDRLSRP
ncbi:MAG: uroporphyrinogen decarboxylase family protein [Candidatus Latescibacteria bacterium]|jgi:hypothetical protein|nr:uroporphyrinogen decarboxylase family protein [Candidatus Latescibacterota bacterium]